MKYTEKIWKIINTEGRSERFNRNLFLLVNSIVWLAIGLICWGIVQIFALKASIWAFCFAGYACYFGGLIGGIFFLWRKV